MTQFDGYDYQQAADGSHVVIKDGKRVEDAHGNLITFENFVRGIGEQFYEFTKQDDRGNAGNAGSGGGSGNGSFTGQLKTIEDYNRAIGAAKTPKERIEIRDLALKAGLKVD